MSKPNIYDLSFADRMKTLCDKYGSKAALAQQLGVTPITISRWVQGTADPTRTNIIKISKLTGVSVEWLILGTSDSESLQPYTTRHPTNVAEALEIIMNALKEQTLTDEEARLLADFRTCNHDNRQAIVLMAKNGAKLAHSEEEKESA